MKPPEDLQVSHGQFREMKYFPLSLNQEQVFFAPPSFSRIASFQPYTWHPLLHSQGGSLSSVSVKGNLLAWAGLQGLGEDVGASAWGWGWAEGLWCLQGDTAGGQDVRPKLNCGGQVPEEKRRIGPDGNLGP